MDIREHRKHLFLYYCIYSALHSNGVVAQQRVYMSKYINSLEVPVLTGSFFTMVWEIPNTLRQGPSKIRFDMNLQVPIQTPILYFKSTS
jgi:hypothetical protein